MADMPDVSLPPDTSAVSTAPMSPPPPGLEEYIRPELDEAKFGGPLGQLTSVVENLAPPGTKQLAGYLGTHFGLNPNIYEEQAGRERANPVLSELAGVGSFALTSSALGLPAVGGQVAKGLGFGSEAAISAATDEAANIATQAGLKGKAFSDFVNSARIISRAPYGVPSQIMSNAIKTGIETGVYTGANEAAKKIFSDPSYSAESAIQNISLSALLGAGIGGLSTGTAALWRGKFAPEVESNLGAANDAQINPISPGEQPPLSVDPVKEGFLKTNAPEIQAAFERNGMTPTTGTLASNPIYGAMEETGAKTNTPIGVGLSAERKAIHEGQTAIVDDLLSDKSELSEVGTGKVIKKGLQEKVEAELAPLEEGFEAERRYTKDMDVQPKIKAKAASSIMKNPLVGKDGEIRVGSPYAKEAEYYIGRIKDLDNVDEAWTLRTEINKELKKAYNPLNTDGNKAQFLQTVKDAVDKLRTDSMMQAGIDAGGSGKSEVEKSLIRIADLSQRYAAYKNKLSRLGVESGMGQINSARAMTERLSRIPAENMPGKFFDINDVEGNKFLKENFPEQYELARRRFKADLHEKSVEYGQGKGRVLSANKFLAQVQETKLGPEAQEQLFPGKGGKLNDLRMINAHFPGVYNPSNTSTASALIHFITHPLESLGTNLEQFINLKARPFLGKVISSSGNDQAAAIGALKAAASPTTPPNAGAFKTMVDYIKRSINGDKAIQKVIGTIFKGTAANVIPSKMDLERLDKKLSMLNLNPTSMMSVSSDLGHYLPDHGMAVAQKASNIVSYLNSIRPAEERPSPLDEPIKPSNAQMQEYHKALEIALQPLGPLSRVKDGTIDATDIAHLTRMYPAAYNVMKMKLMDALVTHVSKEEPIPYKTKMGLSVFFGQPLDSTMQPASIQAMQMVPTVAKTQMPQAPRQGQHHSFKNLGKLPQSSYTPGQTREMQRQKP